MDCDIEAARDLFLLALLYVNNQWGTMWALRPNATSGNSVSVSPPSSSTSGGSDSSMVRDLGVDQLLGDADTSGVTVVALCNTGRAFRSSEDAGECSLDLTRRYVTSITPRYRGMNPRSGGASRSTAS